MTKKEERSEILAALNNAFGIFAWSNPPNSDVESTYEDEINKSQGLPEDVPDSSRPPSSRRRSGDPHRFKPS